VDQLLYALLILTACLAGMFVARNSDIWRELAVGRLLVQGKYTPGSDPLSYTGAGRAWVNPNILYEPFSYALYSIDPTGKAIVAVKAFAFASVFVVLFQLRRKGSSLWPWCLFVGLAVLACAPQATLRPQVYGMVFLASALLVIHRGEWTTANRRIPLLYGGLVALWGMFDASAFLGPLLILLIAVGETIRKSPSEPGEPAPSSAGALWRTLPFALAGWLLNPSILLGLFKSPGDVLGQLIPTELFFGYRSLVIDDPELVRTLSLSAFVGDYTRNEAYGANANGIAALVLLVSSGIAIAIRFRVSQLLVWLAFAYLPLAHYRWIPFFALAAAPIAALFLASLGSSIAAAAHDEQRRKILTLAAGIVRIFSLVGSLAMLLAAIPGWLHPKTNDDPAFHRRVDWGLEADTGARRGAELIAGWRSRGELPAEVNLLLAYPDYGDYSAWFSPGEKVFADTRYQFHRPELPDLVAIREVVRAPKVEKEAATSGLVAIADRHRAAGIVICRGNTPIDNGVVARAALGFGPARTIGELFARVWVVDGRFAAVGRNDTEPYSEITGRLSFDAIRSAFGPTSAETPAGSARRSPESVEGIVARFLERPQAIPAETDDALMFRDRAALETQDADGQWALHCAAGSGALAGGFNAAANSQLNPNSRPPSDTELAYELMALRSARTGAAKNPDSPLTHRALASACQLRFNAQAQTRDAALIPLTAFIRALARSPQADRPRNRFTRGAILDGLQLFLLQLKLQQSDSALQTIQSVLARLSNAQPADFPPPQFFPDFGRNFMQATGATLPPLLAPGEKPDALAGKGPDWIRKKLEDVRDETRRIFAQKNELFTARVKSPIPGNQDPFAAGKLTLAEQFVLACELGLPQKALDLVPDNLADVPPAEMAVRLKPGLNPQFVQGLIGRYRYLLTPSTINRPPFDVDLRIQSVAAMIQSGKVEQADEMLRALDAWIEDRAKQQPNDANTAYWREATAGLKAEIAWLAGDFPRNEEALRQRIREHPKVDPRELVFATSMIRNRASFPAEAGGGLVGSAAMSTVALDLNRSLAAVQTLRTEAYDFYELGLNALYAGNASLARDAFTQALKPQGVPLADLGVPGQDPVRFFAGRYLNLIERAAEKSP
jgi:hypothetical protein